MEIKSVCGACGETAVVTPNVKGMDPLIGSEGLGQWMEPDGAGFIAKRKKARGKKMRSLGAQPSNQNGAVKDAEDDTLEEEDISLEEVKEFAADFFRGKALDAGTGNGMHVVQVEMGNGDVIESYWDEKTVKFRSSVVLDASMVSEKGAEDADHTVISSAQALDIAMKHIAEGMSVKSELVDEILADEFEGEDAWVVPVRSDAGDDYDVFVSLSGQVLGYDTYIEEAKSDEVDPKVKSDGVPAVETPEDEAAKAVEEAKVEGDATGALDEKSDEIVADDDFLAQLAEFKTLENQV